MSVVEAEVRSAPFADADVTSDECMTDSASLLVRAIEALLLASETPLTIDQLQRLLAAEDASVERPAVRRALALLAERLADGASEVVEVAGGWRLQVRADLNRYVARLWQEKPPRLSRALLETLALVVYRQPITRGEIEEVRGVAVSTNIVRTLLEHGWIRELGHKEVPGRPTLYGSTGKLLDDLGLKSLSQLPDLPEIRDPEKLEAALRSLGVEPGPDSVAASAHAAAPDVEGAGDARDESVGESATAPATSPSATVDTPPVATEVPGDGVPDPA
ncbi:MAG TPA: SMC-Scp complex subunit ScpB [Nevskiaceae bacterium]|nr:SMC-Scp complex subunit ScpB [Nevskiaceae bacterium]